MTLTVMGRRHTVIVAITEYLPMDVASTGTRVPKHGPAQGVPCEVEIHYSTHARPYWDLVGHRVTAIGVGARCYLTGRPPWLVNLIEAHRPSWAIPLEGEL